MTHDEVRSLLGAYALDAVNQNEQEEIARHVEQCSSCLEEVIQHREVASLLALDADLDAPLREPSAALWSAIASSIAVTDEGSILPLQRRASRRHVVRSAYGALGAVAAALLLVVVGLGAYNHHLSNQVHSLQTNSRSYQLANALSQPSHQTVMLKSPTGVQEASAVITKDGTAYFVNHGLLPVSGSKTFQLWAVSNGRVISLGVLGTHPKLVSFKVEATMSTLMVNVEPLGGVPSPTTPVLAQGAIVNVA
jgi:anti-sigma-K factor RskA